MSDPKFWGNNGRRKKHGPVRAGKQAPSAARSAASAPTEHKSMEDILEGQKRVVEAIASRAPIAETLKAIAAAVEVQFPDLLCSILLTDDAGTHLHSVAADSLPAEYNQAVEGIAVGPSMASFGAAAHRRELVVVTDIATDPLWRDFRDIALRHGLKACWSHPILSPSGQLLGTFAMYFREPRAPSALHLDAIRSAASLAGIAIERHRADEHLERANERFKLVSKATNDVVWDWDLAGNTLWWSEALETLFGYDRDELEPGIESWTTRVHPDDHDRVVSGIYALIKAGGQVWSDEYRFKRRDGTAAYVLDRGFVMRDAQGKVVRMIGAMMDITERKAAEEALRDSQSRLRLSVQASNIGLWDRNVQTDQVYLSPEWKRQLGYADDEIPNRFEEFQNRLHPDDVGRVRTVVQHHIDGGMSAFEVEFRLRHRDQSYRWIYARAEIIRDAQGRASRILGCHIDITERKRAEEAMARHAVRQETVAALGQFALGHAELNDLLNRATSDVARGLGIEYCKILEYVPEEKCLLLRSRHGWDSYHPGQITYRGQRSLESYCLEHNEPLVVADLRNETRFAAYRFEQEAEVSSAIAVIIHGEDKPYGVLSAHSKQTRRFSADEVNFVQSVANVLATAIERKAAEERLAQLAQFDPLTGLPNRNLFRDRLSLAVARAQRDERLTALLFLDLDQFKEINDTLGHEAGDQVLKNVSARLRGCLRADDTIARLGGDEFTVIVEDMQSSAQIERVAEKVLHAFANPIHVDEKEFFVTPSIGVAVYPYDGKDGDSLLKHADIAMYQAKNEGRNTVQFYASTMSAAASDRVSLERSLRQAIERKEFLVYYQPVVDMQTGAIVSVEALLRWQHPEWGLVAPGRFLQVAEQTGLIVPIGEWVLHEACAQSARWQQAGLAPIRVAVNLSARQFRKSNLVDVIGSALRASALPGQCLELEITESLLMESPEVSSKLLDKLKSMGIHVTLDDFGTGYSSFSYLKHFPLDTMKIDRSFVRDITSDPDDAAIVVGMTELAHSLGLKVIAEGTETQEQAQFLRTHRCDYAQGYLFSRPQPADELLGVLKKGVIRLE